MNLVASYHNYIFKKTIVTTKTGLEIM